MKPFAARPRVVKAFNRHRNNRHLEVNGKNSGAFLEGPRGAIDAALAFGIKNQDAAVPQPESPGTHGRNQVPIGIDDDYPQPARQPAHKA